MIQVDFTIHDLSNLPKALCDNVLMIVRCPSDFVPVPVDDGPQAITAGCYSLLDVELANAEGAILPAPPVPDRFLKLLAVASPPYLRMAKRLWGMTPLPGVREAWLSFLELGGGANGRPVPQWAAALVRMSMAAWDGEWVYVPRPVLAALGTSTPPLLEDTFLRCLQGIRNRLARAAVEQRNPEAYRRFALFLAAPRPEAAEYSLYRCVDLSSCELDDADTEWLLPAARAMVVDFKQAHPDGFSAIVRAQQPLWEAFGVGLSGLVSTLGQAEKLAQSIPFREGDYDVTCAGAHEALTILAEAFHHLGRFERRMGVDRYMAPALIKPELSQMHELVRQVRRLVNRAVERHRQAVQMEWGNFRVAEVIKHAFDQQPATPFNSRFPSGQKRVILFVIDGLGYVQHRWSQLMERDARQTMFGGSVFGWLADQPEYNDKRILGAPWITDTGAGLSQIFTGRPSRENKVYSSQMYDPLERRSVDIKDKEMTEEQFRRRVDSPFPLTFFSDLHGVRVSVLTAGGGSSGAFSQRNFGSFPATVVNPPERFPQLLQEALGVEGRQFITVYYPLIDRYGHSLGSFSSFELHEYDRLNQLLSSFILQLLAERLDLFDGETSLFFVADHGMFESSTAALTLGEIRAKLEQVGLTRSVITIANRAVFLHNVRRGELQATEKALRDLLRSRNLDAEVVSRTSPAYRRFLYDGEDYPPHLPDIIVGFRDEGIAVTRPIPQALLHYGAHGGWSAEEVFVPFVTLQLTPRLADALQQRYGRSG